LGLGIGLGYRVRTSLWRHIHTYTYRLVNGAVLRVEKGEGNIGGRVLE
jgi:hypothetical protein